MSARRVLRYEVPVDDEWHEIEIGWVTDILHVASRRPDVVEFWALDQAPTLPRRFRVYGTGQPGVEGDYVGTALAAGGSLVWHLFEHATVVRGTDNTKGASE